MAVSGGQLLSEPVGRTLRSHASASFRSAPCRRSLRHSRARTGVHATPRVVAALDPPLITAKIRNARCARDLGLVVLRNKDAFNHIHVSAAFVQLARLVTGKGDEPKFPRTGPPPPLDASTPSYASMASMVGDASMQGRRAASALDSGSTVGQQQHSTVATVSRTSNPISSSNGNTSSSSSSRHGGHTIASHPSSRINSSSSTTSSSPPPSLSASRPLPGERPSKAEPSWDSHAPMLTAESRHVLQLLLNLAYAKLDLMDVQGVANTVHSLALLRHYNPPLLEGLLAAVEFRLDLCTPQNLSNLILGVVYLRHTPGRHWMKQYYTALEAGIENFGPQDVANTLWAFGRLQHKGEQYKLPPGIVNLLLQVSYRNMAQYSRQELAICLWGLARLGFAPAAAWYTQYFAITYHQMYSFRASDLSLIAWSMGQLGLMPDPGWMVAFFRACNGVLHQFTSSQLCQLLTGIELLNLTPPEDWSTATLAAIQRHMPTMRPKYLINSLRSAAQIGCIRVDTPAGIEWVQQWLAVVDTHLERGPTPPTPEKRGPTTPKIPPTPLNSSSSGVGSSSGSSSSSNANVGSLFGHPTSSSSSGTNGDAGASLARGAIVSANSDGSPEGSSEGSSGPSTQSPDSVTPLEGGSTAAGRAQKAESSTMPFPSDATNQSQQLPSSSSSSTDSSSSCGSVFGRYSSQSSAAQNASASAPRDDVSSSRPETSPEAALTGASPLRAEGSVPTSAQLTSTTGSTSWLESPTDRAEPSAPKASPALQSVGSNREPGANGTAAISVGNGTFSSTTLGGPFVGGSLGCTLVVGGPWGQELAEGRERLALLNRLGLPGGTSSSTSSSVLPDWALGSGSDQDEGNGSAIASGSSLALNAMDLCMALHGLAYLQVRPSDAWLRQLLSRIQQQMAVLAREPNLIAMVLWSLLRLRVRPPAVLLKALLAETTLRVQRGYGKQLAMLLSALAGWGLPETRTAKRWMVRFWWRSLILLKQRKMEPASMNMMLASLVRMRLRPQGMWMLVCHRAIHTDMMTRRYSTGQLSWLLKSLASLDSPLPSYLRRSCLSAVHSCRHELLLDDWGRLLWAFLRLKVDVPAEWATPAMEAALPSMTALSDARDLTLLLRALLRLNVDVPAEWAEAAIEAALPSVAVSPDVRQLTLLIVAAARLVGRPSDSWMASWYQVSERQLVNLEPAALCTSIHSLALMYKMPGMHVLPPPKHWLAAYLDASLPALHQMSEAQLERCVWSVNKFDVVPEAEWVQELVASARGLVFSDRDTELRMATTLVKLQQKKERRVEGIAWLAQAKTRLVFPTTRRGKAKAKQSISCVRRGKPKSKQSEAKAKQTVPRVKQSEDQVEQSTASAKESRAHAELSVAAAKEFKANAKQHEARAKANQGKAAVKQRKAEGGDGAATKVDGGLAVAEGKLAGMSSFNGDQLGTVAEAAKMFRATAVAEL